MCSVLFSSPGLHSEGPNQVPERNRRRVWKSAVMGSAGCAPPVACRVEPFLASSWLLVACWQSLAFVVCRHITPVSARDPVDSSPACLFFTCPSVSSPYKDTSHIGLRAHPPPDDRISVQLITSAITLFSISGHIHRYGRLDFDISLFCRGHSSTHNTLLLFFSKPKEL